MSLFQLFIDGGFTWYQGVRYLCTTLTLLIFFSRVPGKQPRLQFRVLGYFCLLAPLPDYLFPDWITSLFFRFISNYCNAMGYLYFTKNIGWKRSLYYAAIWQILHTTRIVINMTPFLTHLRWGEIPTASFNLNMILSLLLEFSLLLGGCELFWRNVNLSDIRYIELIHVWVVIFFNIILQYEKFSLKQISGDLGSASMELTVYPIFVAVLIFLALIFFHRYLIERERREQYHILNAVTQQQLRNAQAQVTADQSIRRLHHDMKKHLLAIRSLSEQDGRVSDYVNELLKDLSDMDAPPETGSPVLNGLLSEKLHTARALSASLNILVDLSAVPFLEPTDICVIFGNALDNALEAVQSLTDPKERVISVRSSFYANTLILDFANSYSGSLSTGANGLPASKKGKDGWHGIGLASIQHTVEKYDGVLAVDTSLEHLFHLKIMIPLPEQEGAPANTI